MIAAADTMPHDPGPLAEFGGALVVLALLILLLLIGRQVVTWVFDGSDAQDVRRG